MSQARGVTLALILSAALVTQAYSLDASATVVNVDEFAVVQNGTTIFDDSFDRNTTLNGGSGTSLPSGTTFSDGTAANYRVVGSFPKTTGEQRPGTAEYRERSPDRSGPAIHSAHPGGCRCPSNRVEPRRGARLNIGEHVLGDRLVRPCRTLGSIGKI